MKACVLIVEDDSELRRFLQLNLEHHDYRAVTAADGPTALRVFAEAAPDLVVLDVDLPGIDGMEVCRRLREHSTVPILMMTAQAVTEAEIAAGLNIGADEYILKPLGNVEFHARVNALLRRAALTAPRTAPMTYDDGFLMVDLATRRVQVGDSQVRLTPTEFNLLATFIRHDDEVLTFRQILEQVWGPEYKSEHHYPRIYVSHLRRKIEPDYKNPTYIHNEYGVGYRFVAQPARS
jgi:two-component system, OmpR family, KDP operon response regulator KdpE